LFLSHRRPQLQLRDFTFLTTSGLRNFTANNHEEEEEHPIAKMSDGVEQTAEQNIEIWKVKKLIKRLEAARGNGTSMISLIIRTF